jgi:hypothetical protein
MQKYMHTRARSIHIPCFYMTLITNMTEYAKNMKNMHIPRFWYKKIVKYEKMLNMFIYRPAYPQRVAWVGWTLKLKICTILPNM